MHIYHFVLTQIISFGLRKGRTITSLLSWWRGYVIHPTMGFIIQCPYRIWMPSIDVNTFSTYNTKHHIYEPHGIKSQSSNKRALSSAKQAWPKSAINLLKTGSRTKKQFTFCFPMASSQNPHATEWAQVWGPLSQQSKEKETVCEVIKLKVIKTEVRVSDPTWAFQQKHR